METPARDLKVIEVTMAEAVVLLRIYVENNDPVWLWGQPGLGKSESVHPRFYSRSLVIPSV